MTIGPHGFNLVRADFLATPADWFSDIGPNADEYRGLALRSAQSSPASTVRKDRCDMGTISSSTGLISGLDIESIVTKLMAIEKRPLTQLQTRVTSTQTEQTAYAQISARLMASLSSIGSLALASTFSARSVTSSLPTSLTATAASNASLGTYSFLVRSVVSTHQMTSGGYTDRSSTPVGAGTLNFETAAGRVDNDTELSTLNAGEGVHRGKIRITDRSGNDATIDLRTAYTMGDVLEAINSQTDAAVRAYVSGDRLVIEDQTGLSTGTLTVANLSGSTTAADLGIAGSETGTGSITSSSDLVQLTGDSALSALNDGLGIRFATSADDIKVTLANGRQFEVDLTPSVSLDTNLAQLNGGQGVGAGTLRITSKSGVTQELQLTGNETIKDIKDKLAAPEYADLKVNITSVSGSGNIIFSDASGGTGELKIEDVSGSIAEQFELAGETDESTLTGNANYQFTTIDALVRTFQYARDGADEMNSGDFELAVSADGKSLSLIDHTTGSAHTSVESLNGSMALQDMGLTGTFQGGTLAGGRVASGINTVLLLNLNGGAGVDLGTGQFQLRDGTTRSVDFTTSQTLQDVINAINAEPSLHAEVSAGGTSLVITDLTSGSGTFTASGATLDSLHASGSSATGKLQGGDLNRKYISENTLLSSLNGGEGIGLTDGTSGSIVRFQITNSSGETASISLTGTLHHTIGDVIDSINTTMADKRVHARVNTAGDGIELYEDLPLGAGKLTVSELEGGDAAAALHLVGEATDDNRGVLTGSFAGKVEITASDTLDDVVSKINAAGVGVRASVINDGSAGRPYRLVITSSTSGTAGQIGFSNGGSGISLDTLTEAQDARVLVGSLDSANSILISSSTNEIKGVADGVTINLVSPSDTAVQVTVGQNTDSVVASINSFISAYNGTLDAIDELTKYDAETEEKGILLGDSTVLQIRDRLQRQVSRVLADASTYRTLASVGITNLDASSKPLGGGRLRLDEEKFREAIAADPEAVEDLFTKVTTTTDADGEDQVVYEGFAARLKQEITALTNGTDGLITLQTNRLQSQVDLFNKRIEDLQTLLDMKENRYYAQFQAMETALSNLQAQQAALSSLTSSSSS